MDYKNFIFRFIISIIFLSIYLIVFNNKNILLFLGCIIYFLVLIEIFYYFKIRFFLIFIYLLFSFFCFSFYILYFFDIYYFNLLIFTIILFDTSSYITGTFFGRNYLFKKISPKKTLEGFLGGLLLTNLFCLIYLFNFDKNNNCINTIFLINIIIITSVIGDLIQSYFKRLNNIKNSSNLLPGHGGFFDRFDSFIFTIYFLLFYFLFF